MTSRYKTNREFECPRGEVTEDYADVLSYTALEGARVPRLSTTAVQEMATLAPAVHGEPPVNFQAYHTSVGQNEPPMHRVVIHTAETGCLPGAADGVSRYFESASSGGSAQYVVDPRKEDHCVHEATIAWHAPPNQYSIGIEITGRASFGPQDWQAPLVQQALQRAAARTADLVRRYGLPVVWLSPADLLAGKRGITGHVCVSQAWHQSDHTDPGPHFPVKQFLSMVHAYLGQHPTPVPGPKPGKPSARLVRTLQRAAHLTLTGHWDKSTDAGFARLRDTHPASGVKAVKALQKQLGLRSDGIWGPITNGAMHNAVVAVQKALGVTPDGNWGSITQSAYQKARAANLGK